MVNKQNKNKKARKHSELFWNKLNRMWFILEHMQVHVHTHCEKYKIKTKRVLFYEYVCKI